MTARSIQTQGLKAFDVHVHLEAEGDDFAADVAARKYFGESGAPRDPQGIADYYRSRNMDGERLRPLLLVILHDFGRSDPGFVRIVAELA